MSRHRLHLSKLDEFAAYCAAQGYSRGEPIAAACEVLRLTKSRAPAIIAHARHRATQHATLHGEGERMFSRFVRAQQQMEVKP